MSWIGEVRGEVLCDIAFKLHIQFLSCLALSAKPAWDNSLHHVTIFSVVSCFSLPASLAILKTA